ncbi:MAG: AAA family ATPase, partial [bacterium]
MSIKVDIKSLLGRLNPYCKRALEGASGHCVNSANYEVAVDHMMLRLLEDPQADAQLILKHNEIDPSKWVKRLQQEIESFRSGNPGKPVFSRRLLRWFEESWILTSLNLGLGQLRSGSLLAALVDNPMAYGLEYLDGIDEMTTESIKKDFDSVIEVSNEKTALLGAESVPSAGAVAAAGGSALEKYTTNFTARARAGEIDPVFGREREIRQMVDILGRRRKNNPIAVGEAGVGKTAVVEGLALKVAEGDVPDIIRNVDILGLDLGLLQAGASVKGEFENRLNAVITEIKASEKPLILFIDEAHTLIGAGGAAGTGDAANLLKPALARGELRTVAATTWSEYKKYFEKDPALARRFQLVKLDEPSAESTAVILRGLRKVYEGAHDVYVRDDAITAAANLSARYISGRQLPDKAVDVLDTACARVKISLTSKPAVLEDLEKSIQSLEREKNALTRDVNSGRSKDQERLDSL